ncbi:MAG: hypothetical protein ACRCWQ_10830 [Bacilli bacterium]
MHTDNNARMLALAFSIAANEHMNQFDKGGNPYFLHPLKVMRYTRSDDCEIMTIAILHDVVEDTPVSLEDLRRFGFSERVVVGVDAVTKRPGEKKEESLNRVLQNRDACIVKLADLRHNSDIRRLKGLTEKDLKRMQWYHQAHMTIVNVMTQMGWN